MSTKPKQPATERTARADATSAQSGEPFEGNHLPATFSVELSDRECQLHVTPEAVKSYCKGETHVDFQCCLTNERFKVPVGGLVYVLHTGANDHVFDPPYLAPQTVARGFGFIREKVLHRAAVMRANLRYEMERIVAPRGAVMERGAEMEVVFDVPEMRFL